MGLFTGAVLTCCGCPEDYLKGPTEGKVKRLARQLKWQEGELSKDWYDWLCPYCAVAELERIRDIKKEVASC
jgi:hypothetical protein